jgi:hypothetical protein
MSLRLIVSAVLALMASTVQAEAVPVDRPASAISYTRDIQPIFTEKCVACHACYDSACQLNLGSAEGAVRAVVVRLSAAGAAPITSRRSTSMCSAIRLSQREPRSDQPLHRRVLFPRRHRPGLAGRGASAEPPDLQACGGAQGDRPIAGSHDAEDRNHQRQARGLQPAAQPGPQ